MNANIQKAIDCLKIHDVYQRKTNCYLIDGFDPKYSEEIGNLSIEFKHFVTQSEILELNDEQGDIALKFFRVYVELGARWIASSPETKKEDAVADDDVPDVKASIEATFLAEYLMRDDPGKPALDAFALHNASYHVWPYWREYLMSQCSRMNMPKVALPIVQFASNHEEMPTSESDSVNN